MSDRVGRVSLNGLASLVGRDQDLGTARDALRRSMEGAPSALLVSGEAGIGKTALMQRVLADAPEEATILRGAGLPMRSLSAPFLALRTALRDWAADTGVVYDMLTGGRGIDPVTFDGWLDDLAESRPVVLALDDVQWVDPASLDVLLYVVANGRRRRVFVILTLRVEEAEGAPLEQWLADVRRLPGLDELCLDTLDRVQTGRQIASIMGSVPHEDLVEDVFHRSRGNPYLNRLLVSGVEPGATGVPGPATPSGLQSAVLAGWHGLSLDARQLTTVLAIAGRPMSTSEIVALAEGRIDAQSVPVLLGEACDGMVLELDRSGGYWFHHPLQAELLAEQAQPDDRHYWHQRCAKFLASRLEGPGPIDAHVAATVAGHYYAAGLVDPAYRWALVVASGPDGSASPHDVVRALRRALELHQQLSFPPAETRIELLWRLRRACSAIGDMRAELAAVEELLDLSDPSAAPEVRGELLVWRMLLRMSAGVSFLRMQDAEEAVERAGQRPGTWQHALTIAELSHIHSWNGMGEGGRLADEAVTLAEATEHDTALAFAYAAKAMSCVFANDLDAGRRWGARARCHALRAREWWAYVHAASWESNSCGADVVGRRQMLARCRREMLDNGGPHPYVAILANAESKDAVSTGDVAGARELVRFALASDPGTFGAMRVREVAGRLAVLTGEFDEAAQHLARAEELFGQLSDYKNADFGLLRVEYLLGVGRPREAFTTCDGEFDAGSVELEVLVPRAGEALADWTEQARAGGGDFDEVLRELSDFVNRYPPLGERGSARSSMAPSGAPPDPRQRRALAASEAWYAAELARATRDPAASIAWQQAAAALDGAVRPWEAAYAWMRLGEAHLLSERPDRRAAAAALRGAVQRAAPLEARPVLERVEVLARSARIDVSVVPEAADEGGLPGLTRREREILEHVVAGRTYSEIATALVISEKTISSHISNMLRKTGTSNRHELAARATDASSDVGGDAS